MAKVLATIKAVITRLVFAAHGFIAIWQVTVFKKNNQYWCLASPILLLLVEGLFTLTIKENQEWKWFCPSVFIYLGSVVPAIWLLELHKVERRIQAREEHLNLTDIEKLLGTKIQIPAIPLSTETWVTLIEQFLMLTLIVGRWLLPKGDLTRDQLSQLLLVYIGTAADIIEFFDSFKDDKVVQEPLLVLLTLGIWSWSLMQFTVVLTATKSRKSRGTAHHGNSERATQSTCCCSIEVCAITMNIALQDAPFLAFRLLIILLICRATQSTCCCSIEVCAITMNIALQDAPFLAFRLLIITHYSIVSYMNIFFTCKNTLVILLQVYRLYVLHSELGEEAAAGEGEVSRRKQDANKKRSKTKGDKKNKHERHGRDRDRRPESSVAVISETRKEDRVEGGRIRAIILTSGEDFKDLELSKLFKDQITLERVSETKGKASKKKPAKSETSVESLNQPQHTTDDSGI